jgi:hypothetical protein
VLSTVVLLPICTHGAVGQRSCKGLRANLSSRLRVLPDLKHPAKAAGCRFLRKQAAMKDHGCAPSELYIAVSATSRLRKPCPPPQDASAARDFVRITAGTILRRLNGGLAVCSNIALACVSRVGCVVRCASPCNATLFCPRGHQEQPTPKCGGDGGVRFGRGDKNTTLDDAEGGMVSLGEWEKRHVAWATAGHRGSGLAPQPSESCRYLCGASPVHAVWPCLRQFRFCCCVFT